MVLLFLSPVFFPVSAVPERFQVWMYLNPLTFIIEEARKVLLFGRFPDWEGWGLYLAGSVIIAWAGFWWFQKTRRGFADVL
jgi:lipopolysaccharide transport system permease protein